MILENINSPHDVKTLSIKELKVLAEEIRQEIITVISRNGGHMSSNLGVVELTLALLYVFDFPKDKIVWDVGHQSYVYKILTGRRELFKKIRLDGGLSGFPNTKESEYDFFNTGHSSTSVSAVVGMARARDIRKEDYNVIGVIGDGALSGGMAIEAINDLGLSDTKALIILNDNEMSISKNVGGISKRLSKMRISGKYTAVKHALNVFLCAIPLIGKPISRFLGWMRNKIKNLLIGGKLFEQMGLNYSGPFNGHNIKQLISALKHCKRYKKPLLLHVITKKGKGSETTEKNPSVYHGVSPNCPQGKPVPEGTENQVYSFSEALGNKLCALAKDNGKIVTITAAMKDGTGLAGFAQDYPDRFFDVGIAEQHAVTMAAGLAINGVKPYVAVYSSFFQRAYDQILHDVCLQSLPVTLCVDRAGVVGSDGATHQGIYDLSFLRAMPNMTIYAPKDVTDLQNILEWSLSFDAPLAIRYPKDGCSLQVLPPHDIKRGAWQVIDGYDKEIQIIACGGRMINLALDALQNSKISAKAGIINAAFVKPVDKEMLDTIKDKKLLVLEDNVLSGGLLSAVLEYYAQTNQACTVRGIGLPDMPIDFGTLEYTFTKHNITAKRIEEVIKELLNS